jgi:hypothetical protein
MTHTAAAPFRWHIFARHVATIGAVLIVVGLIALLYLGMRPLRARTIQTLGDAPVTVQFLWPKVVSGDPAKPLMTWIPREWQERLLADARASIGVRPDPLDPAVLASLRDRLDASGWFVKAPVVRRDGATGIVVEGDWRTPAAVVKFTSNGSHDLLWLSTDARPMPKVADPGRARPRVLENPSSGPPLNQDSSVNFNAPWPGADIAAGLDLLALVATQAWASQVAGVDLADYAASESLTLTTIYGTRVVWGGPPSKPRFGDASTKDKLRHVATLFGDTRRIDGGHPTVFVDSVFLMFDRSATAELRRQQANPGEISPKPVPEPSAPATPPQHASKRRRGT